MVSQSAVTLARQALATTFWLAAPILVVAIVVGLVISVLQTMTSIQDTTISTVPRLASVGLIILILMPWLIRKLVMYTTQLLGDFRPYLG
jgi:flagellar biosynthesis protein FliQ